MAESSKRSRSWLKLGCLGVAGLVGLGVVWAAVLFGTAYTRGRNEELEKREVSHEIPEAPVDPAVASTGGRVVLDFTVGEFHVVAGEAGEPLRIAAEYDRRSYELQESFEPSTGSGWTYRATFKESTWFKDGGLRVLLGGSYPRIKVFLPPDVPLALDGSFGKGAANIELGGLWLTEIDLVLEKGALMFGFDVPPLVPVERISVSGRQGGVFAHSIGNASPRVLEIDHRMGGMTADLRGAWVRDAEIRIACRMGGAEVRLPEGVDIVGLPIARTGLPSAHPPELSPPRLTMSVSSRLGNLELVEPTRRLGPH